MLITRDEQKIMATGKGTNEDPYILVSDVYVQDQFSKVIILPMVQELGETALSLETVVGTRVLTVANGSSISTGNHIRIIDAPANRYYFGRVLSIAGNIVTVDTPIDFKYAAGSEVTWSNQNLNVNGSVTPVIFRLRTGSPSIPSSIDITRLVIICETTGAVDLNKFGDIPALSKGIVLRAVNGSTYNIFNLKKNADMAGICHNFLVYSASNPSQGRNGFSWALTFNGQENLGVVLRVLAEGNLEMMVQDDLSALIQLRVTLEGHTVV